MSRKDYNKWRNSLEGILYDLSIFGVETEVDEEDEYLIAKTLQKLPEDVREKVLTKLHLL